MVSQPVTLTATYVLSVAIILLICELLYIRIARHYGIGDDVSNRSSHSNRQLTGGGIIIIIAAVIYYIWHKIPIDAMLVGAGTLAIVSFVDDIKNISPVPRLIVQLLVVSGSFFYITQFNHIEIFIAILLCGVGFINAYNFMDGINGMMAGYSIVTLATLLFSYIEIPYAPITFMITLIIAVIIFAFFNFRKTAFCFSGDVGSITMGYLILYLTINLIAEKGDASCIVFVMVYAIDSVFTIIQRLFMGENIFEPHKHHLYQILANQRGIPHYKVALGYTATQLGINIIYFIIPDEFKWTYVIAVTIILCSIYFTFKRSSLCIKE